MIKTQSLNSFINLLKDTLNHFSKIKVEILKVFGLITVLTILAEYLHAYINKAFMVSTYLGTLAMILYVAYLFVVVILVTGFIASLKKKKDISLKRMFNRGNSLLVPSMWVGIISLVINIGGFTLFIIPGIILAVYLTFAKISVLIDGKTGFDALVYSFNLVRGYWVKVFWKIFLATLVLLLFAAFVANIMYVIPMTPMIYGYVNTALMMLIYVPLQVIFTYHLYEDVKSKPRIESKFNVAKVINFFTVIGSLATILYSLMVIYLA